MDKEKNSYVLPASILLAGVLIAGSVIYAIGLSGNEDGSAAANVGENLGAGEVEEEQLEGSLDSVSPVTASDHIKGNIKAPVKIVEFSDLECPFCKRIHPTLLKIQADYKDQVVWAYRHFPLESIHPNARKMAEASECATDLGGNDGFWNYVDKLFENDQAQASQLAGFAEEIGLNKAKFQTCLSSGKFAKRIDDQIKEAVATGGRGTPWSILIGPDGKKYPISGAQPYEAIKQIVDEVLKTS